MGSSRRIAKVRSKVSRFPLSAEEELPPRWHLFSNPARTSYFAYSARMVCEYTQLETVNMTSLWFASDGALSAKNKKGRAVSPIWCIFNQELNELIANPPAGCVVEVEDESNLYKWKVLMDGPEGSPYEVSPDWKHNFLVRFNTFRSCCHASLDSNADW